MDLDFGRWNHGKWPRQPPANTTTHGVDASASAFILSQYGRPEVFNGWESRLGYGTRGNSRRKYRSSPNFGRWNHRKWPRQAPADTATHGVDASASFFILSQYGYFEVYHCWESWLGYETRGNSRRKYESSSDL